VPFDTRSSRPGGRSGLDQHLIRQRQPGAALPPPRLPPHEVTTNDDSVARRRSERANGPTVPRKVLINALHQNALCATVRGPRAKQGKRGIAISRRRPHGRQVSRPAHAIRTSHRAEGRRRVPARHAQPVSSGRCDPRPATTFPPWQTRRAHPPPRPEQSYHIPASTKPGLRGVVVWARVDHPRGPTPTSACSPA
jgi:hypothetical protein